MDRRYAKQREQDPPKNKTACDLSTEVRVMAASGLWQDLQEGLVQAETICNALIGDRYGSERCEQAFRGTITGQGRPGQPPRSTVPGIDLLVWRTASGGACGRGGEGI